MAAKVKIYSNMQDYYDGKPYVLNETYQVTSGSYTFIVYDQTMYNKDGTILSHTIYDTSSYTAAMPSYIPANTVTLTTPVDLDVMKVDPETSGRDGLAFMCTDCDKLLSFDMTSMTGTATSNYFPGTFANCKSLKTVVAGDWFSSGNHIDGVIAVPGSEAMAINSHQTFYHCESLETISGVFNFADDTAFGLTPVGNKWTTLADRCGAMFLGCNKLSGLQIHITGDAQDFVTSEAYKYLGLQRNQFTLV